MNKNTIEIFIAFDDNIEKYIDKNNKFDKIISNCISQSIQIKHSYVDNYNLSLKYRKLIDCYKKNSLEGKHNVNNERYNAIVKGKTLHYFLKYPDDETFIKDVMSCIK